MSIQKLVSLGIVLLAAVAESATVAPGSPAPTQDPLMALMLSQPRIDTTSPVIATSSFDPPLIAAGQSSTFRVVFNALEESIEWPARITGPPYMSLQPGGHGQILQMGGNVLVPQTTFNTRVRVSTNGDFVIPQFTVKVYDKNVVIPAARLQVLARAQPNLPRAQELQLELAATNLYSGEPVLAKVILPGSERGAVQGLSQVQLTGEGFLVDQASAHPRIEAVNRGGTNVIAFVHEVTITPIATGRLRLSAQGFTSGSRVTGPIVMAGPQYTLLDSDPIEIRVRPLPKEGELPGFAGAIGHYSLDTPRLSTNVVRVGEPLKLSVLVRGDTNVSRLVPPPSPQSADWQVLRAPDRNPTAARQPPAPTSEFSYTLVPTSTEVKATPAIPFSYFDPKRQVYVDLTISPVPITVLPGASPIEPALTPKENSRTGSEELAEKLQPLAVAPGRTTASLVPVQQQTWFPFVQLAPAALFLGLVWWDKRRRFLELHPDVVVRRRARRALRRERKNLHHAAQAGDADSFVTSAVRAMRIGCAPHYPAEPRALVGQDVLKVLPNSAGSVRHSEVVRRIFAVADAARFSAVETDTRELLRLKPDLDSVLTQLEAGLGA